MTDDLIPTREAIRDICTQQSFQRGVEYFEDSRVRNLSVAGSEDQETLTSYRADVVGPNPEVYFETYQKLLEPFLASDIGRNHYRTVIEHLHGMERLGFEDELDGFVTHLKEKHSNRPALLDELDTAGF